MGIQEIRKLFKIGTGAHLRSYPETTMIVDRIIVVDSKTRIECVWMNNGNLNRESFSPESLYSYNQN